MYVVGFISHTSLIMTELKYKDNKSESNSFLNKIVGLYIILVCVGVPLIFHNKYFDILNTKYYYYCACSIIMTIILLTNFIIQWRYNKKFTIKEKIKEFFAKSTWVDYCVILFYGFAVLSTFTSDYLYESFWGNEGRLTGLFLMTWYVLSYFCISRFLKFSTKYIDIILISGLLVSIIGITDYFNLDILNFKALVIESQKSIFTSTIGNINTYTAYVGIIVAISTVLFSTEKEIKKIVFYFIAMVIGFFAIIMGVSDNAYLSLGALFAFLPLYLFKDSNGVKRYIIVIATFFSVIQIIGWINSNFSNMVLGIDSSFNLLIGFKGAAVLTILLWLIILTWYIIDSRKKNRHIYYGKTLRFSWLVMLIIIFLAIIYAIYDCNINGNSQKYGSLSSYLLFNDAWGTHRGYIWRNAIECYLDLSWWKKAVGFGPETFGILMLQKTANNPYKEVFDSAHNEYLHLLTTVGFMGLLSYISFIIGVVVRGVKYHINKPYIVAVLFGIICYSVQAFVNLNLPIVTPVFWALLGIASSKSLNIDE